MIPFVEDKEMFTDSFKMELIDGVIYKVYAKEMIEDNSVSDSVFGGNKSAEAEDDDVTDDKITVIDVVSANKLEEIPSITKKKEFMTALTTYIEKLKENLKKSDPERAEEIKQPLTDFVKGTLLPNFNKIRAFYAGEGDAYEVEGSMAIAMETDIDTEFHIYYFKDGLYEEKM